MTRYQFTITIGASPVNLATAAFAGVSNVSYPQGWTNTFGTSTLLATRLEAFMDVGGTGDGFIGASNLTNTGANKSYVLPPSPGALQTGGYILIQPYEHMNVVDLAQYWAHGGVPGDVMVVVYHQA